MEHITDGYTWISLIFVYIVFTIVIFVLLKTISIQYRTVLVNKRNSNVNVSLYYLFLVSLFILMIFFPSFRYIRNSNADNNLSEFIINMGGNDSIQYRDYYYMVRGITYREALKVTNKEFLYVLIIWILSNLKFPYQLCLVCFNTMLFFGIIKFCKMFDLRKFSLLPLLSLLALYLASFNTMRWSITLFLSSYVCESILDNKFKRCLLLIILSVGIQEASIVLLMPLFGFWVTKNLRRKKLVLFYIFVLCVICYIPSTLDLMVFQGMRHFSQIFGGGQIPITWLLLYGVLLINIVFYNRNYLEQSSNNKKVFYFLLFLLPPTILEFSFFLAYRFSYYSHPIFYMYLVGLMDSNRKKGIVGIVFNVVYSYLLLTILLKFWFGAGIESVGIPFKWFILNQL